MTLFTVTLPNAARADLPIFVEVVFALYVLVSFVCVAGYVAEQVRTGRLINGIHSPRSWLVTRSTAWLFILCVLGLLFIQSAFYMILVVMGLFAFLIENRSTAREQFGLERLPASKLLKWSLLICGAAILLEVLLSQVVEAGMNAVHLPHPEQQSVEVFRQYNQPSQIFWFMVQAVLISPLIEELFFRGFLYTFLKNYTSTWMALILSAGVFAFAHVNLGSVVQLWVLGIILGVAYEHTGAILLPMGIHACFNFVTALSLLLDKGNS